MMSCLAYGLICRKEERCTKGCESRDSQRRRLANRNAALVSEFYRELVGEAGCEGGCLGGGVRTVYVEDERITMHHLAT